MIDLKELALVNETIWCLRYKTLRYIKVDPYVHLNFIIQYTHYKNGLSLSMNFMVWHVYRTTWCGELQCNEKLVIK
jgi:hypothetical protein